MAFEPLNTTLYAALQRTFGEVKVANEGRAFVGRYDYNSFYKRNEMVVSDVGEQYRVCCPFCADRRFRLHVSHRWGVVDENKRTNKGMLYCFNEDCLNDPQNRHEFDNMLTASNYYGGVSVGSLHYNEASFIPREIEPPGLMHRLDKLPYTHAANRYLAGRFFDPEGLGRYYGVSYCPSSVYTLARNRIIIPLYDGGELKGWQARYIGDLDWHDKYSPPKYFSCPGMRRGQLLYNLDRARNYCTGVIVEGPMDVWAFGPMTMASFGFPMSESQARMVQPVFGNGSLVLLFDADVRENPKLNAQLNELYELLKGNFAHGVAVVQMPSGTDPANFDRYYLRHFVAAEAKAQGVKVLWKAK